MLATHLLAQGVSKTAVAQRLGISRRLLYTWLETGQLADVSVDAPRPPRRLAPRPTKLDPYLPLIAERLAVFPALSAVRLLAEIRAAGYTGGYTQLKTHLARVRPRPEPEPVVRFETAPGEQAQFDFAHVRLPWGTRYAVLVVLGYSRLLQVEFVPRQTALTVMHALERAFEIFGGVPREILFDQMRSVVVEDQRPGGGRLLENPEFGRFAAHWGFRIRACRPYRARTKGKVERPIRYLRESFLYGRTFLGDGDLAEQCQRWVTTVANQRCHGTTREAPAVRFARDEADALQPLALRPYRALVLPAARPTPSRHRPMVPAVAVERRALADYGALLEATA